MSSKLKIAVLGLGYVGSAIGVLLSQKNKVVMFDPDKSKVNLLNNKLSPVKDSHINEYLKSKKLDICATSDFREAIESSNFTVIATPTDYDEKTNSFDTSSVDQSVEKVLENNKENSIIIKSTIPIGYTKKLRKKYKHNNIFFSPEFLREGMALSDSLYPSRIIIGGSCKQAQKFSSLLKESAINYDVDQLFVGPEEAESIKLFSNAYLAMRVAFFNEIDSLAIAKKLNTKEIIDGVSLDARIGRHYNNPSFGYGGYCLPKDTKQLKSNFKNIPEALISAIIDSNLLRKNFLYKEIKKFNPKVLGVYRLIMKKNSDNYRSSAIFDIFKKIIGDGIKVIVYEPIIESSFFEDIEVVKDLEFFKKHSDLIITNRKASDLEDVKDKVYTRDIYGEN